MEGLVADYSSDEDVANPPIPAAEKKRPAQDLPPAKKAATAVSSSPLPSASALFDAIPSAVSSAPLRFSSSFSSSSSSSSSSSFSSPSSIPSSSSSNRSSSLSSSTKIVPTNPHSQSASIRSAAPRTNAFIPPQVLKGKPNVATEDLEAWNTKASTRKSQSSMRD
eukprot:TRINITY_DN7464_c0_g1_i3.p1 TRINITY_DN7464_c0_g1~~TRINITY_DN7464_c0_g1_i3.p1  ORF type:complete len:165 (+),score=55.11 TRINITY_DN7464_c0_g1_i3:46-540(+)